MAKKSTSKKKETTATPPPPSESVKPAINIAQEKLSEIKKDREENTPPPPPKENKALLNKLVLTFVKNEERAYFYELPDFYLRTHEKIDVTVADINNTGSKYEKPYFDNSKILAQMKEEGYITIIEHIKNTLINKPTSHEHDTQAANKEQPTSP